MKDTPAPTSVIDEQLFASRTVLVFGEITMALAERVSAQLLALASLSKDPIRLIVHSPGGHVESADTIHDLLRWIDGDVYALGTGWVASAGAHIFLSVPKERRFALPNTRFLLHQPAGATSGTAADIEIEANEITRMRARLLALTAEATGQPIERVRRDTDRNCWLSADEAMAFGVVGSIIRSASELPPFNARS